MDKKKVILQVAQALFSRFGLRKVTTDDIAREAGVSKATVYNYYPNKTEIFHEIVKLESDQLLRAIREAVDAGETVAAKFKAHLITKMTRIKELINFYQVTQDPGDNCWPFIASVRDEFVREEKKIVAGILKEGNERGELDVKNVEQVAQMMVVSLQSQELAWATAVLEISLDEYVDMMIEIMIEGIRKRQSEARV